MVGWTTVASNDLPTTPTVCALAKSEAGDGTVLRWKNLLRGNIAGLPRIVEPAQSQTNADESGHARRAGMGEYLYDLTEEYYQVISETTMNANGTSATTAYALWLGAHCGVHIIANNQAMSTMGVGSVAQAISVPVAGESAACQMSGRAGADLLRHRLWRADGRCKVSGFTHNAEAYDAATEC